MSHNDGTITSPLPGHEPAGDPCHDLYPGSGPADAGGGDDRHATSDAVRVINLAGNLDQSSEPALSELLRDPHVSAPVIVDLTGATLDAAGESALVVACLKATERNQRLVVVVSDPAERAALYDLGITNILPIAQSEAEARTWLDAGPARPATT